MASGPNGPSSAHSSQNSSPTSPSFLAQATTKTITSLEAPLGLSYSDFVRQWTDAHVARWLADNKCATQSSVFRANDIRGDVILDLDHATLKEMGIMIVGERARILHAVKQLRTKCSTSRGVPAPPKVPPPPSIPPPEVMVTEEQRTKRRGAVPPPLTLKPTSARPDLPQLVRATATTPRAAPTSNSSLSSGTHGSAASAQKDRHPLPPLPPVPRSNPPAPPSSRTPVTATPRTTTLAAPPVQINGRRTPEPPQAPPHSQLPPAPNPTTPLWSQGVGLPRNPRDHAFRLNSPQPQTARAPLRSPAAVPAPAHQKTPSLQSRHPFASSSTLEAPSSKLVDPLSPIKEDSNTLGPAGHPGRPTTPLAGIVPSLDDLRRKQLKFSLAGDGHRVVHVHDCEAGVEVLERVLKKFGKASNSMGIMEMENWETMEGGLILDGWGVFYDESFGDGKPLTEAQLLSVCHADLSDKARELGLTLRRVGKQYKSKGLDKILGPPTGGRTSPSSPTQKKFTSDQVKKQNRASTASILSGLGVKDDRALVGPSAVPQRSPASPSFRNKPSKLRNFFGQRPPSELITTHLPEFFPFTERKVLERTQRHSFMRSGTISSRRDSRRDTKRESAWNQGTPSSRFSTSTYGSRSNVSMEPVPRLPTPPPLPEKPQNLPPSPPRMAVSTEDGRSIEFSTQDLESPNDLDVATKPPLELLPPVLFNNESLSDSLAHLSRQGSAASRRMSYLQELRSKRDKSDTASMLTVDEITQEVESRRASWDGRDAEEENKLPDEVDEPSTPISATEDADDVEEDEEEPLDDADGDDGPLSVPVTGGTAPSDTFLTKFENKILAAKRPIKWICGALIGSGSFGSVYLAMDKVSGLLMAVKQVELPTGSSHNEERKKSMLTALEREIALLKELQHENIVQYLDSSMDDQFLNIFLEYVPGGSVTALLGNYGAFEEALVWRFVRQILQGLNYLHERDIIHRDIKGANILVDNKGGIKISDFGISKKVADNILSTARVNRPSLQGSVFWMAPEVVKQTSYTRKADIWSLGCLIVEMFTGQHPYPLLNQMQAIFKIGSSAKPTIPSDISSDAEDFLARTFEIDYQARPSAAELLLHPWIVKDPDDPAPKASSKAAPAHLPAPTPEVAVSA